MFDREELYNFHTKHYMQVSCQIHPPTDLPTVKWKNSFVAAGNPTQKHFKVCKPVHHHTIQINQPTRCKNFSSLSLDVYVRLNMFRASSRPSSGAQQLQQQPLVLPRERDESNAVGRGRPDHDQQHCYHHTPTVKPEAATAVVELLMMGVRAPETC